MNSIIYENEINFCDQYNRIIIKKIIKEIIKQTFKKYDQLYLKSLITSELSKKIMYRVAIHLININFYYFLK